MTGAPVLAESATAFYPMPGWELVMCVGGAHDQARFWSRRPPERFRVVPEGDVYQQRDDVWVAEGHAWAPAPPSDDQMRLA